MISDLTEIIQKEILTRKCHCDYAKGICKWKKCDRFNVCDEEGKKSAYKDLHKLMKKQK